MSFTPKQYRAIAWLCKSVNGRPHLTVFPNVRVEVRATGEIIERPIKSIVDEYDVYLADQAKERARERLASKAHAEYRP